MTFRFAAPNAREVRLALEGADPRIVRKDARGVWTVTPPSLDAPLLFKES